MQLLQELSRLQFSQFSVKYFKLKIQGCDGHHNTLQQHYEILLSIQRVVSGFGFLTHNSHILHACCGFALSDKACPFTLDQYLQYSTPQLYYHTTGSQGRTTCSLGNCETMGDKWDVDVQRSNIMCTTGILPFRSCFAICFKLTVILGFYHEWSLRSFIDNCF